MRNHTSLLTNDFSIEHNGCAADKCRDRFLSDRIVNGNVRIGPGT